MNTVEYLAWLNRVDSELSELFAHAGANGHSRSGAWGAVQANLVDAMIGVKTAKQQLAREIGSAENV